MTNGMIKKWFIMSFGLLVLMIGSACGGVENTEFTSNENAIRVAAVGDSITNYISGNNYPEHLDELLGDNYAVQNFGESNHAAQSSSDYPYHTTDSYQESLDFNPEIVIIMLGTNDTKSHNWNGAESFKIEYIEFLESYLELESVSRVILASPPAVFLDNVTEGSINPDTIESIRSTVEDIAKEYDLEFVDMVEKTASHGEWFPDGIHPNEKGAEELAAIFYHQIEK